MQKYSIRNFVTKLCVLIFVYLMLATVLYWIVKQDWTETAVKTDSVSQSYLLPSGSEIRQQFQAEMDCLSEIIIIPHFVQEERTGYITLRLAKQNTEIWSVDIPAEEWTSDEAVSIAVEPAVQDVSDLSLSIFPHETGLAMWAGDSINTGRLNIPIVTEGLEIDGVEVGGSLVLSLCGYNVLNGARWFWPVAIIILFLLICGCCIIYTQIKKRKQTVATLIWTVCKRYQYLLHQLVGRDFKVKYKSSFLGVIWSFLNPLLTMLVYLFVFSTLFNGGVPHFPVYLMTGIVCFNYFGEATNLGMTSIVSNSVLITKVYMPKMIYPLSKVLSSAINLCISFIPLTIVMMLDGVIIHKSLLLLPVVVVYLIAFSFGMSLILSTLNVFFRDTVFLWSVLLTMLNFLTPIFYPESIIPQQYITIFHLNPLYQIINFMRTIILNGCSPTPITYLNCTISAVVTLIIGVWVFRKNQDRFVLYL